MAETTTPSASNPSASPTRATGSTHSVRNALLLFFALVSVGGLVWYLLGRGGAPAAARGGGRPTAAVGVASAELADVPVYLSALGTVQPVVAATVRPQLAGTLFSIDFQEGQRVKKDDLLAQIDPRPYKLALSQAEGTLARDQAQLSAARGDLARYTQLLQQDSIARQQVDTQAATVRQLEGTVLADEASVGTARLNLAYTSIRAPVSGKVGLRQADIGNYLTPSDANGIVVITQTAPIDIAFALPQDQVPQVQEKLRAQPEMQVTARDKANSAVLGRGTFLTFDNQVDTTTGTVRAKARFANADERLLPNQFVNVELLVDTLAQAITVPVAAVRHGAQGDFIFVLLPDKTAKLSVVKTGPSDNGRTVILSGIDAGDTVITEGADRLEDGARVNLPGQGPGPGRAGGEGAGPGEGQTPARGPGPGPDRGPVPDARNERRNSRQR
ncbi:MAG TPA: MdtA/MuxA family multidrug efflux RND transporter periplasmic adaptor subunit [Polyangiaceae bacterium]|nr:MdtA/MuxA family multidrug efflux RND transporter periplasmic adaptor subunit [Polyangiaceae bacterium]